MDFTFQPIVKKKRHNASLVRAADGMAKFYNLSYDGLAQVLFTNQEWGQNNTYAGYTAYPYIMMMKRQKKDVCLWLLVDRGEDVRRVAAFQPFNKKAPLFISKGYQTCGISNPLTEKQMEDVFKYAVSNLHVFSLIEPI